MRLQVRAFLASVILFPVFAYAAGVNPSVKVIVFPGGFNWPIWVAQDKGYFAKEGLQVEFAQTSSSGAQFRDMMDGKYQIASTSLETATGRSPEALKERLRTLSDRIAGAQAIQLLLDLLRHGELRLQETALLLVGYFIVWLAFGVVAYALGVGVATAAMRFEAVSRAVPRATAVALVLAGAYQCTTWKQACLARCRSPLSFLMAGWRRGMRYLVQ